MDKFRLYLTELSARDTIMAGYSLIFLLYDTLGSYWITTHPHVQDYVTPGL